ncbi:MAG: hypothetical protein K8S99_06570 [Planctomycetes bacterium]|nr:hypothetical protein [Planctomycetota bacterium]
MKTGRRLCGILVVFAVLAGGHAAWAQIPAAIITASTTLGSDQQKIVDDEVKGLVTKLINFADERVGEARTHLLDPFERGPSDIFRRAYSQAMARELVRALNSDRVIVRVNAMLITSRLEDPGVVPLVVKGLADPSQGVRYWAARTVNVGAPIAQDGRAPLLVALTEVMKTETSVDVLEQVLGAMVALDAFDHVLNGLNDRVAVHAQNPAVSPSADTEALRRLYQKLVQDAAGGKTIAAATLRELARASYRLLDFAAMGLDTKLVPAEMTGEWKRMIEVADAALRWTVSNANRDAKLPAEVKPDLATGNWPAVRLHIGDWVPVLTAAPLNLKPEELAAPKPATP